MSWGMGAKVVMQQRIAEQLEEQLRMANFSDAEAAVVIKQLIESAIRITPPEQPQFMEMIVMGRSGRGGGLSVKPGNLKLDLWSVLDAASVAVLTLESTDAWWKLPLGLLIVIRSLKKTFSVDLSEEDAVTILAMWRAGINRGHCASFSDIELEVNLHAQRHQRSLLSAADIRHSIGKLQTIGSIRPIAGKPDTWCVLEELRFGLR